MQVINIQQLKTNPSAALHQSNRDLIMITNHDKPNALLIGMEQLSEIPNIKQVRLVLAISLFRNNQLSITAAAKVAGKSLSQMLTIVSEKGIPVVDYSIEEANTEIKTAEKWLKKSY